MLIIIAIIFIVAILLIIQGIKSAKKPLKIEIKPVFVSGNKNHNEITKIQKGQCTLKFEDGKFWIIQGENQIEDISADIYHIRVWKFKGSLYMAIRMKTHSEYMFLLADNGHNNEMAFVMMYKIVKHISDKLKVEFKDCGESDPEEEE